MVQADDGVDIGVPKSGLNVTNRETIGEPVSVIAELVPSIFTHRPTDYP